MLESKVVSGKVIEQRGNKVITVQGGLVSSYDLRYYSLPSEADFIDGEEESEDLPVLSSPTVLPGGRRYAFFGFHGRGGKKSAYRA
ncbi:hypothetical protein CDO73_21495 [Saccharibacillus sp. O23]|uniref:hypothetical protein n=1 Tax=Saccharibacillus sp. O23 TaxID=2009338 RepID=UPI000B4E4216|nr:hypothetical protein [Saccharibacillus sp. O23]OWR27763.1 hypothetical protein CDO73_21495 [Saccharibacillus sp. O23]